MGITWGRAKRWGSVHSASPAQLAWVHADAPEAIEPRQPTNNAPNEGVLWYNARVQMKKTRSGHHKER